jgi:RimJ/RimL family protein N-acetyltransferase
VPESPSADTQDVETERLQLVSLSPETLELLLEGRVTDADALTGLRFPVSWPEQESWLLRYRLEQMQRDPSARPWLLRAVVLRDPPGTVIGHINFHEPPKEGAAEIGYTIEPEYRRRGYAIEAIRAMFDWARERGTRRFIASVAPTNDASLALVSRLGFVQTGVQWDELDGEELVFERGAAAASPG